MSVTLDMIEEAAVRIKSAAKHTELFYSERLSHQFKAKVYLKREDQQIVRSFKIRGAYNKISSLTESERKRGVVCASAGNHAQGVAYSCNELKIHGTIFMPAITPAQKIAKVRKFGGKFVDVRLEGITFDDASIAAKEFCKKQKAVFVHPFNDELIIAGQGTVGKEVYEDLDGKVDYVLCCLGGGGLVSGVSSFMKAKNKKIKVLGVEPTGAAGMDLSIKKKKITTFPNIDNFVDGAAVGTVGELTFEICKKNVDAILLEPEGKICTTMLELYQNEGIIVEPAGALAVSALDDIASEIKGKTVVCVISGGNNDVSRYPEVIERSLRWQGLKHYFLINFAQKPGQLRSFVEKVLGPGDDITRFEYVKKTNAEKGPALVGIILADKKEYPNLLKKFDENGFNYREINEDDLLYKYLV